MDYEDLASLKFDGQAALRAVLEQSSYQTIEQAVASLAAFANPKTVRLTGGRHIFCVIRTRDNKLRGQIRELEGGRLKAVLDDNEVPTNAFIWAHGISRNTYRDVQFNHLWSTPEDVSAYTSLANICMLPAFLSKLTDTNQEIQALLRYRAFDLYDRYHPSGTEEPRAPQAYSKLRWADPLPFASDLEQRFRTAMSTKPRSRATVSARVIGWLFSKYKPDALLPDVGSA